ncbi:phosphoribosylformylglycinamidine synthase I [bacterium]|nr:phosphoribosylformylglycinamidine synthase I [bacterium]
MNVAVIQFPGSNCEYETVASLKEVGIEAAIVPWNSNLSYVASFKGFVLPGGFSFQDRVRAGVVSSKLPILDFIKEKARDGFPILGICNGCQILAESGILSVDTAQSNVDVALSPNMKESTYHGFVCDWVYVKITNPQDSLFTRYFNDTDVIPIQINHGEGNFKFLNQDIANSISSTQLIYTNENGDVINNYPINPNGSDYNIAGLSNKQGNVFAMMPHPERGMFWYHVPRYLNHDMANQRRDGCLEEGPWRKMFESLRDYIKEIS